MSGQPLTLLVGVPRAAWLGGAIGWRGVNVSISGLALMTTLSLLATTAGNPQAGLTVTGRRPSIRGALSPIALRLLCMWIAERV
jgi:predicted MFS family arabinose efflux permease